jgi:hypothetical protein
MSKSAGPAQKRWEDITPIWTGPSYTDHALKFSPDVRRARLGSRLITCVDIVDWDGNGGRDVLMSNWDACYDGGVFLRQEIGVRDDGTPVLGPEERVEGVHGYVTSVRDGEIFHLVATSRLRPTLLFYRNVGTPTAPHFADGIEISLDVDWVKGGEVLHMARFADIDGDGKAELIVGTDYWHDYWPHGKEWNEDGYRAFDAAGRWLGGPLRGFAYVFKNNGTPAEPKFGRGKAILSGDHAMEVYGQFALAFGDFHGTGRADIVAGEFLNVLHYAPNRGDGSFDAASLLRGRNDQPLLLDHCIHFPCAVDWRGTGKLDLLVGGEDGYVLLLANTGEIRDGAPVFAPPLAVETENPQIHAGVLSMPAVHDFCGKGRLDLITGTSQGEILFFANVGTPSEPRFARDVPLTVGGERIRIAAGAPGSIQGPSETRFGYTCPTVFDWDGDGHPDIVASDVTGYHRFFRNDGSDSYPPRFEREKLLRFEGKPLKTVWRVRPTIVDWDGAGQISYVTLDEGGILASYDRQSPTELTNKTILHWENGEPIRFTEDIGGGMGRMKLHACQWTGGVSFDLLVGTHGRASIPPGPTGMPRHTTGQAGIILLRNVGSGRNARFAEPVAVKYKGEPIAAGMHEIGVEAVDWKGDGTLDLLIGIEDGSVVWLPRADLSW